MWHYLGSFAALRAAISTNCNLLGGAELHGPSIDINSLTLLRVYFIRSTQDVDQMILRIKGALSRLDPHWLFKISEAERGAPCGNARWEKEG